jgi:hypothetical protein
VKFSHYSFSPFVSNVLTCLGKICAQLKTKIGETVLIAFFRSIVKKANSSRSSAPLLPGIRTKKVPSTSQAG